MKHENNIKAIPTAEEYEAVVGKLTRIWDNLLIFRIKSETNPVGKSGKILDVGMGTAIILRYLAQDKAFNGFHFTGIDYFSDMVSVAKERILSEGLQDRITVDRGDANLLDFEDHSFDVVISRATLHHLEDPTDALKEKYRVLKPGGFAIIHDARRDAPEETLAYFSELRADLGLNPTNISEKFTMKEMREFIKGAGLEDYSSLTTATTGPESIGFELMIFKPLK